MKLVEFPLNVSGWGANISYYTDIFVGNNGNESRNELWQDPLYSFNAAFAVRTLEDIQTLQAFFHIMKGRGQSFLVKDHADHKVAAWENFAEAANGTRTTFQMIKRYTYSIGSFSETYTRTITKPSTIEGDGGVSVRVNGSQISSSGYSVNGSTGIVTFTSPPANGADVDFKCDLFYVPCRFDIDTLPIELLNYWVLASGEDYANTQIPDIPLKEVRNE